MPFRPPHSDPIPADHASAGLQASIRPMALRDLPGVLAVQQEAYAGAAFTPEHEGVYRDRMALAPALCLVAADAAERVLGYLVSHPVRAGTLPALDTELGALAQDADCWYLHDCAVAARAHGQGLAAALYAAALACAQDRGLRQGALVAVGDAAGYWARWGYRVQHSPGLQAKLAGYGAGACYMVRTL